MLMYIENVYMKLETGESDLERQDQILNFMADMLINNFEKLIKGGMLQNFKTFEIQTDRPKGRIDIERQIRSGAYACGELRCKVQSLDIDNYLNQIIKLAFVRILKLDQMNKQKLDKQQMIEENNIDTKYIRKIKFYIELMDRIETLQDSEQIYFIDITEVPDKYKQTYAISKMIIKNFIPNNKKSKYNLFKLKDDEKIYRIYEDFLIQFYRKNLESRGFEVTKGKQVKYEQTGDMQSYLRVIPDGLIVDRENKLLIILDAKYYDRLADSHNWQDEEDDENQVGIDNAQIGKSCLYACRYRSLEEFKDYKIITAVVMAKNLPDSVDNFEQWHRASEPGVDFQMQVVQHSLNKQFDDIRKDLISIIDIYIKDN